MIINDFELLEQLDRRSDDGSIYFKAKCLRCGSIGEGSKRTLRYGRFCRCDKRYKENSANILGQRFGRLSVIQKLHVNNKRSRLWLCKCDCGSEKTYTTSLLRSGKTISCGCYHKEVVSNNAKPRTSLGHSLLKRIYQNNYKDRAEKQGWEFKLTYDDFLEFYNKNCYYCGSPPATRARVKQKSRENFVVYNGIDRLDNTKGYVEGNMVTCCKHCNYAKHTLQVEEFKKWVKNVYEFWASKN